MKIGFIGTGIMGRPMAHNLIKHGHELVVHNRTDDLDDFREAGAIIAGSGAEVAAQVEVLVTMLPNSPHVLDVMTGSGGILEGAAEGLIVVDMSSIAPGVSQEVEHAARAQGVTFLDAPVSGGEPKAKDGTLAIMVGGDQEAFTTVEPILRAMGSSVTHVGAIGAGNVTKLANQIIVALNIAAVSEAFTLATRAGVDPEAVFDAIRGGLAGSTVLDAKMPMILEGDFAPGFRIELHIKDLQNALEAAHELHTPVPLTAGVMEIMQAIAAADEAGLDHSGIIRHYERLAHTEVRKTDE